jgi:hypothetical protein
MREAREEAEEDNDEDYDFEIVSQEVLKRKQRR